MSSVLLVDDDHAVREAIGRMLVLDGHSVNLASDGASALAVLDGPRPDLILLDLLMPTLNGQQLLAELQRRPECAGIPVVVLTGTIAREEEVRALGACGLLRKPVSYAELIHAVLELTAPHRRPGHTGE